MNRIALAALLALVSVPPALAQDAPLEQTVYLHENLHIVPERINARVGDTIQAHVINAGQTPHDLLFCGDGTNDVSACQDRWSFIRLNPGQEGNITVEIKEAGTFDYYCSIPGHKQGGMRGELIVQGSTGETKNPIPGMGLLLALAAAGVGLALLRKRPRRPMLTVGLLAALLLAGCAAPAEDKQEGGTRVAGFRDVHGLALDPSDASALLVATHDGLIRGQNGTWTRVGSTQHDLMGFSQHPTNARIAWASGHPKSGGNLGLVKTTDGGLSWTRIALEGVDFHAMTVSPANPDHLWGIWRGQLQRSTDGGASWTKVESTTLPRVLTLAADPFDVETLYAGSQEGAAVSVDGGKTWKSLGGLVATVVQPHPTERGRLFAAGPAGVHESRDAGQTWTKLNAPATSAPIGYLAIAPTQPPTIFAATYRAALHKSTDGGATWQTLQEASQ